jgi:dephospho-CoA kinase
MIRSAIGVIGLTGGIGSGKTTVSDMLTGMGAVVIDTDLVARDVVEPDGAAHAAVRRRFGPAVVGPGGEIDRAALARLVFADPEARSDLNALVHPAVATEVDARLRELAGTGTTVVLVVPLLVEAGWTDRVDHVVVVDCPEDTAVRRLVGSGRLTEREARQRVAAQASRQERLNRADTVIDNSGPADALGPQVEALWEALHR